VYKATFVLRQAQDERGFIHTLSTTLAFGTTRTRLNKVKILHLIDSLYGAGGAERQLLLSIKALDASRFESYICCVQTPGHLAGEAAEMGIKVFSLGVNGKLGWPKAIMRLRRLIRSLGIELVHTSLYEASVLGGLAGRLSGVPVVTTLTNTVHDTEWLSETMGLSRWKVASSEMAHRLVIRWCMREVIAVSEHVKQSAVRHYRIRPDKITVIHRALSPEWLGVASSPKGELPDVSPGEASPTLIAVGRLIPQKDHESLLRAMAIVARGLPEARLLIAGEGQLMSQLKQLCDSLELNGHVSFLGRRNDVRRLLETSDIFVLPSLREGCPNALIEAMSVGIPCVATSIGPVTELVRDGEHVALVPPSAPEAMAEAIVSLTSRPDEARAMGHRAKEMARRRFTPARVSEALESVYMRVLARRAAPERVTVDNKT
jgi:glycosyltransferase involved in cell wall biosynthesis